MSEGTTLKENKTNAPESNPFGTNQMRSIELLNSSNEYTPGQATDMY